MKVPLLDLKSQLQPMRSEIINALVEVVDSTRYILGPKVEALENEIAAYSGVPFGIGVSSGTDAILIALMALGIGPDQRVVTTPFSFFATAGAIVRVGARPVLVDIDPETFNISSAKLNDFLDSEKNSSDIAAVIPVHLFGQIAEMDAIIQACAPKGIALIEDAAQSIGAQYFSRDGIKRAGSLGDMGCFSFFPSKNLGGLGDGGMVITRDNVLAGKLRILRNHGANPKYYHSLVGGNFRLDPIQAAVLLVKFPYLDSWSRSRQLNADRYDQLFEQTSLIKEGHVILPKRQWAGKGLENPHIFNQYVIRIPNGKRDKIRAYATEAGIGVEVYYPVPFHLQECFQNLGYRQGDFPESEKAALEVLALPIYPELTNVMQEFVVETIVSYFRS